jgi:hypothetical protein
VIGAQTWVTLTPNGVEACINPTLALEEVTNHGASDEIAARVVRADNDPQSNLTASIVSPYY